MVKLLTLEEPLETKPKPKGTFWCLCGRFAKFVGENHYYNGEFNCYSYTVNCSRCGIITVECV